jgi:23S rRNA (cytosine1962-C5)-methyltransferase
METTRSDVIPDPGPVPTPGIPRVVLGAKRDRHTVRGHPWVLGSQGDRVEGKPKTGDLVAVLTAGGELLGEGLYHERSLIRVRLLSDEPVGDVAACLERRIRDAFEFRRGAFRGVEHWRAVNGEADGIPGTVIDRYGEVLVFSTICAGVDLRREWLWDLLESIDRPRAIVQRDDNWLRAKDGLAEVREVVRGTLDRPVVVEEEGVRFQIDVLQGPKTGFFLDQRFHRSMMRRFVRGKRVLDLFCADGGFGLHAAAAGAAHVALADSSGPALDRARANAEASGLTETTSFRQADLMDAVPEWASLENGEWDVIILDPPAFAKSRRHVEAAQRAYQLLNINAMAMLPVGGILATSSCSSAIDEKDFEKILRYSAKRGGARFRLLHRGSQPLDHPILPEMPETEYLKFRVLQKR